jgi:hypothetical protein
MTRHIPYSATVFSICCLFLLLFDIGLAQNVPLALPQDATPVQQAPPQQETIPDLNIEATAGILEQELHVGAPFHFQITLSWEGNPAWVSLASPVIEWPKSIRQIDVSTGVRSSAGEKGPVGSKSFKYTLVSDKAGKETIPKVQVEVTPQGKSSLMVDVSETQLMVQEKVATTSEWAGSFMKKNGILLAGGAFVILAGLVVFALGKWKSRPLREAPPDPWNNYDSQEKKLEAFRFAGEGREFYSHLEMLILQSLSIARGAQVAQPLSKAVGEEWIPSAVRESLEYLDREITDRKFRPDRPLPEDMDSALKHYKSLVRSLKEFTAKGGKTA